MKKHAGGMRSKEPDVGFADSISKIKNQGSTLFMGEAVTSAFSVSLNSTQLLNAYEPTQNSAVRQQDAKLSVR